MPVLAVGQIEIPDRKKKKSQGNIVNKTGRDVQPVHFKQEDRKIASIIMF